MIILPSFINSLIWKLNNFDVDNVKALKFFWSDGNDCLDGIANLLLRRREMYFSELNIWF